MSKHSNNNSPRVIGITGSFGSGKSTAATFFAQHNFQVITLSAFLEEEAKKRGIEKSTRKLLQDIGNEWRKKYGSGVLAQKAKQNIEKNGAKKTIIDGIRNTGEIEELRRIPGFMLLAIDSSKEIRFQRLRKLQRRETLTWGLFKKLDARDRGVGQKTSGLHIAACVKMADVTITNNKTEAEFVGKLEKIIK